MTSAGGHSRESEGYRLVWERVTTELASCQDKIGAYGGVGSSITGTVTALDTACAAEVFASEFRLTEQAQWRDRSLGCIATLARDFDCCAGLSEPVWRNRRWEQNQGSLYLTGTVLDSLWAACELLEQPRPRVTDLSKVWRYLESCRLVSGGYAHDTIPEGSSVPEVQNTTTIAVLLLHSMSFHGPPDDGTVARYLADARLRVCRGQLGTGFWPYCFPRAACRVAFMCRGFAGLSRFIRLRAASASFGDALHHCLVLYLLSRVLSVRSPRYLLAAVQRGWNWVLRHLARGENNVTSFDFSWEPWPNTPSLCNFCDTTTYFLILAIIPELSRLGIISEPEAGHIATGIGHYVSTRLLRPPHSAPCVKPIDGPPHIDGLVLPAIEQSVAWKGTLLSRIVRPSPI